MSIKGHVKECAEDQFGSRYIQQVLDDIELDCHDQFCQMVFAECLPHLQQLIVDVFANYVIQKLLRHGRSVNKAVIVDQIHGNMIKLTKNKYGCRVVQIAFEFAEHDQRELLLAEFKNCSIVELIKDQNANHVVQKLIDLYKNYKSEKEDDDDKAASGCRFLSKRVTAKLVDLCKH